MRQKLTDLGIRRIQHPVQGNQKYWDTALPGFGLRVTRGTKSFVVMYGQRRQLKTLGRYPEISLSEARSEARRILYADYVPQPTQRHFAALRGYLADIRARLRPNTVREYERHLRKGPDKPLSDIKARDLDLTEPQAITAWKAYFNWCIRHELCERNPVAQQRASFNKRERVLTSDELRAIWQYERAPFSDIIKLCILTGQRRSEIAAIQLNWIQNDTLTIPAHIAKNGHAHTLPFGPKTAQILNRAPFPFNGWSKAKLKIDHETRVWDWVVHDLRRTFATIHASIGTPIHVTERLLNHISGTQAGIVGVYQKYDYLKEARAAALRYEQHIATIVSP